MADPPLRGLPDEDVEELVGRLESLLERVERATGPDAEAAAEAVEGLALLYGTALARVMALAVETPALVESLLEDPLVHHLLALHGLHPRPVRERVVRALDDLAARLRSPAELVAVEDGVARVRYAAGGCRSTAAATERAIRDAVLAAAPELSEVTTVPAAESRRPSALIPVEALLRGPGGGPA